jgi:tetratricopeptide (TPR) repeat protein
VRRALELDPYYTAQKFLLSIELQADDPSLSVIADLSGEHKFGEGGETFVFDQRLLDDIFRELRPAAKQTTRPAAGEDPFALARDYFSKALFDRAVAEVTRAVQRGADRAEGAVLLGAIYQKRGFYGEALERYREARAESPNHRVARNGEVRALLALGRSGEARPLAEALLAAFPDDVDMALMVAEARAGTADLAGAVDVLRRAEERAPARADVRKLLGDVALKTGDAELARQAYQAALELDPGYVEVWLEAGKVAMTRGDVREAERSFRAALERLPSYSDAAHALATLYADHERLPEARDLLITALERDAYDFEALVLLSRVLLDMDQAADARQAAARVVAFRPEHVAAHYHLGVALARERRYREAVQHWERCIGLDPSGPLAAKARMHARTALDLVHIFAGEAA